MTTSVSRNGHTFLDSSGGAAPALAEAPAVQPFEHWAFEVDTPFRPIQELLSEQASAEAFPTTEPLEGVELEPGEAFEDLGDEREASPGPQMAGELKGFGFELGEDETLEEDLEESLDEGPYTSALNELGEWLAPAVEAPPADAPSEAPSAEVPPISGIAPSSKPFTGPKVKLDHWHKRASCDPKAGTCPAASNFTKMTPAAMNPGFIDSAKDSVLVGSGTTSLQAKLSKLIVSKYGSFVTGGAKKAGRGSAGDRIRVALVDLSGKKLAAPEFAGWGSTIAMQGASTTKVVILYALYQLLIDVHREAFTNTHTTKASLVAAMNQIWQGAGLPTMPDIATLLEFTEEPKKPVAVKVSAATLTEVKSAFWSNSNEAASRLMLRITFAYIASVLWQSGLHHGTRGGLWLTLSYGRHPDIAKMANTKDQVRVAVPRSKHHKVAWRPDPRAGSSTNRQNATALSLATMFTLIAQERMVTPSRSKAIAQVLRSTCRIFWDDQTKSALGVTTEPLAKCGLLPEAGIQNDVTLVEHGAKRYVAVVLTKNVPSTLFAKLIADLDRLI